VGGTSSDKACRTHTHLSALSASSLPLSNCGQTLAALCPQGATPACYLSCPPRCLPQRSVFAETREERLSVSASAFAHRRETFPSLLRSSSRLTNGARHAVSCLHPSSIRSIAELLACLLTGPRHRRCVRCRLHRVAVNNTCRKPQLLFVINHY
jgi:hypothetical protein